MILRTNSFCHSSASTSCVYIDATQTLSPSVLPRILSTFCWSSLKTPLLAVPSLTWAVFFLQLPEAFQRPAYHREEVKISTTHCRPKLYPCWPPQGHFPPCLLASHQKQETAPYPALGCSGSSLAQSLQYFPQLPLVSGERDGQRERELVLLHLIIKLATLQKHTPIFTLLK